MTFRSGFLSVSDEEREAAINSTEEPQGGRSCSCPVCQSGAPLVWVTLIWEPAACMWGMQQAAEGSGKRVTE